MKKNYYLDENGKILNNNANLEKMNIFEIVKCKLFVWKDVFPLINWQEYFEAVAATFLIPLSLIFFPITIFYMAYKDKKYAKEFMKKFRKR